MQCTLGQNLALVVMEKLINWMISVIDIWISVLFPLLSQQRNIAQQCASGGMCMLPHNSNGVFFFPGWGQTGETVSDTLQEAEVCIDVEI